VQRHHHQVTGNEHQQPAHREEVPDPGQAEAAERGDQPRQLHGLVQREARGGEPGTESAAKISSPLATSIVTASAASQ